VPGAISFVSKRQGREADLSPPSNNEVNITYIWSECLATHPKFPGSIPGATTFSDKYWVWIGVHSALVRINEELLERKVAIPV
jgi:hypothetical protein